jgi:hypothetical protein
MGNVSNRTKKNRNNDLNNLNEPEKNRTDLFVSLTGPKLTMALSGIDLSYDHQSGE